MNKRTVLENLFFQSGLTASEFCEKVNIKRSTFDYQKNKSKETISLGIKYALILGVDKLTGYENECLVEVNIKQKY